MPVGTSVCTAPVLLAAMGVMKRELERQQEAWLDAWDSAEFEEAAWQAEAAEMEEAAGSTQGAPVGQVLLAAMIAQGMAPDGQPTGQMAAGVASATARPLSIPKTPPDMEGAQLYVPPTECGRWTVHTCTNVDHRGQPGTRQWCTLHGFARCDRGKDKPPCEEEERILSGHSYLRCDETENSDYHKEQMKETQTNDGYKNGKGNETTEATNKGKKRVADDEDESKRKKEENESKSLNRT